MSVIAFVDGKKRNLQHFDTGPYRYDPVERHIIDGFGHTCYQLAAQEQNGYELAERWNTYYATYLMLK